MAGIHRFSFDMYMLKNISNTHDNFYASMPMGVGYIETENKSVSIMEIYEHLQKNVYKDYSEKYGTVPRIYPHPADVWRQIGDIKSLCIRSGEYIVVQNIRKVR